MVSLQKQSFNSNFVKTHLVAKKVTEITSSQFSHGFEASEDNNKSNLEDGWC